MHLYALHGSVLEMLVASSSVKLSSFPFRDLLVVVVEDDEFLGHNANPRGLQLESDAGTPHRGDQRAFVGDVRFTTAEVIEDHLVRVGRVQRGAKTATV